MSYLTTLNKDFDEWTEASDLENDGLSSTACDVSTAPKVGLYGSSGFFSMDFNACDAPTPLPKAVTISANTQGIVATSVPRSTSFAVLGLVAEGDMLPVSARSGSRQGSARTTPRHTPRAAAANQQVAPIVDALHEALRCSHAAAKAAQERADTATAKMAALEAENERLRDLLEAAEKRAASEMVCPMDASQRTPTPAPSASQQHTQQHTQHSDRDGGSGRAIVWAEQQQGDCDEGGGDDGGGGELLQELNAQLVGMLAVERDRAAGFEAELAHVRAMSELSEQRHEDEKRALDAAVLALREEVDRLRSELEETRASKVIAVPVPVFHSTADQPLHKPPPRPLHVADHAPQSSAGGAGPRRKLSGLVKNGLSNSLGKLRVVGDRVQTLRDSIDRLAGDDTPTQN